MACMTHDCLDCGNIVCNNQTTMSYCPKCGSDNTASHWDDQDLHDYDDDRDDDQDEEYDDE